VQKFLRSLPSIFNPNISAIEEMKDLENLTMEYLHGILTGYEMRIEQGNSTRASRKEATFKVSRVQKNNLQPSTSYSLIVEVGYCCIFVFSTIFLFLSCFVLSIIQICGIRVVFCFSFLIVGPRRDQGIEIWVLR